MQLLTRDALSIWQAGVDAVRGDRLVERSLSIRGNTLRISDLDPFSLEGVDRLIVLGGGKASAAMASALESIWIVDGPSSIELMGWINAQRGSYDESPEAAAIRRIHIHPAREPGINEPTKQGIFGAEQILAIANSVTERDIVVCLISGGASALIPLPLPGIGLEEKLLVTRMLSRGGANIEELNEVRRALSQLKGGGLAQACHRAKYIISLIISDVLGDPLHIIGSGPTVGFPVPSPKNALSILAKYDVRGELPAVIYDVLRSDPSKNRQHRANPPKVTNHILANNATAVDAAGVEAVKRGYAYWLESSRTSEPDVGSVADRLFRAWKISATNPDNPNCIISGGEPTVQLPTENCGLGGRNQQLAIELLERCSSDDSPSIRELKDMVAVSGGTDGEDGPTTAAGAYIDHETVTQCRNRQLNIRQYASSFDAFHFFREVGQLLETGPTHTNVCDLRVLLVGEPR